MATLAQMKAALKETAGVYALAAQKLGISRQAVAQRVHGTPDLQAFVDELEENLLDAAEAVIADAIFKKDKQTTRWYLERKGRRRGYVTRQEQTGADGAPLPAANVSIQITYVEARKDEEDVL